MNAMALWWRLFGRPEPHHNGEDSPDVQQIHDAPLIDAEGWPLPGVLPEETHRELEQLRVRQHQQVNRVTLIHGKDQVAARLARALAEAEVEARVRAARISLEHDTRC